MPEDDNDAIKLATRIRALELILMNLLVVLGQPRKVIEVLQKEYSSQLSQSKDDQKRESLQRLLNQFDEHLKELS